MFPPELWAWSRVVAANYEDEGKPVAEREDAKPVIVTIGASAGGVQALQNFFTALPEPTGAAFVVVVHLDPQHRSEMAHIIAARTRMPVVQVGTRERLLGDHVYVIPRIAACNWSITRSRRWNSTSRAANGRQSICSFVPLLNDSAMVLPSS